MKDLYSIASRNYNSIDRFLYALLSRIEGIGHEEVVYRTGDPEIVNTIIAGEHADITLADIRRLCLSLEVELELNIKEEPSE